jgi:hypothetical protein
LKPLHSSSVVQWNTSFMMSFSVGVASMLLMMVSRAWSM